MRAIQESESRRVGGAYGISKADGWIGISLLDRRMEVDALVVGGGKGENGFSEYCFGEPAF